MSARVFSIGRVVVVCGGLLFCCSLVPRAQPLPQDGARAKLFSRDNLVAWCIVPFDARKRDPEERALMLQRLGFRRFAYDWRAEHLPTFDAEIKALKKHGITLDAVWFPAALNAEGRTLLDVLQKNAVQTQLWVALGDVPGTTDDARTAAAAKILAPVVAEAGKLGHKVGLYNHGGWFGEPEHQLAVLKLLNRPNVGIVYNLHHGHDHLDRFAALLQAMKPHLLALNLNGMVRGGDKEILPLGQGDLDLDLLRTIRDSGYNGPLGILGHTQDDAEQRLRDNLEGLDWLVARLDGKDPGPRPRPRTLPKPSPPASGRQDGTPAKTAPYSADLVQQIVAEAKAHGDAQRGALVFRSPTLACLSCHTVGGQGGTVGPDLSAVGKCLTPQDLVESVLWPKRQVKAEYVAIQITTTDGHLLQGYKQGETDRELVLLEPGTDKVHRIDKSMIDERREIGTLMPDNLDAALTHAQRRDLLRFLMELGHTEGLASAVHAHGPAKFDFDRAPLKPEDWPHWRHEVNRERVYDFYTREAEHFRRQHPVPRLLPEFPGLDGGKYGHWGNQKEETWADDRWNCTDLGSVLCGVFRGAGVTVPRAVCVRLGERGELAVCFNPETLCYEALWRGGFLRFSKVRHGFLDGLLLDGEALARPAGQKPDRPFVYHGYFRHGKRVIFSYRLGEVEMLDAPWVEEGRFTRLVAPADRHPLAHLTRGGPRQWPQVLDTRGTPGKGRPYAVDTILPPFQNPWNAPLFFGGHDFLPDGTALLCTMQGDVWRVEGLDDTLERVRWRRIASGLHHALGLVVADRTLYVLGRDQITRLVDRNGDGETDFYECFANGYITSPAGHDFICGLERDAAGNFYTASGNQGLLRISPDGKQVEVLATGFRNPGGLGLLPGGSLTVPCSEGEWTPASMVCEVRRTGAKQGASSPPHFGYGGPREGKPPELPLVYLPRGLDNSSGGQVAVAGDRWGPLHNQMLHFSYGAGSHFLLLRDEVQGQPQGAIVPLAGEFLSGAQRGRFNPKDGQLYVSGMGGWGTYTVADGSFQRVRYTGDPVQLPCGFHVHQNGVLLRFTQPVERAVAGQPGSHFAQCWNYRYSAAYGSPEFSPGHPGTPGHDPVAITGAHVLPDGRGLFLEMPELQPVNQLHLRVGVGAGLSCDLFVTVHQLDAPFSDFPGYRPMTRVIAAHPILADLALAAKRVPNPWRKRLPDAHEVTVEAGKNLTFAPRFFRVKPGESIGLTFVNPDVVPHNWVLLKPGTLDRIGDLTNKMVADPEALVRHYVPADPAVLAYTDIVAPQERFTIYFRAPREKGRYPYLCTFPGHWMVMNGQMMVE